MPASLAVWSVGAAVLGANQTSSMQSPSLELSAAGKGCRPRPGSLAALKLRVRAPTN